jgi:hypothetical protein
MLKDGVAHWKRRRGIPWTAIAIPHPQIVLDYEDPKPRRECGVFCIVADRWANERGIYRGSYFSNIKAASKAMSFRRDEVGKLLRKNRGTKLEGYAIFEEAWFTSGFGCSARFLGYLRRLARRTHAAAQTSEAKRSRRTEMQLCDLRKTATPNISPGCY